MARLDTGKTDPKQIVLRLVLLTRDRGTVLRLIQHYHRLQRWCGLFCIQLGRSNGAPRSTQHPLAGS